MNLFFKVKRMCSRFCCNDFIVRHIGELQASSLQTEDIGKGQSINIFTVHLLIIWDICYHEETWIYLSEFGTLERLLQEDIMYYFLHFISFFSHMFILKNNNWATFGKQRENEEICLKLGTPDCFLQANFSRVKHEGIIKIGLFKHTVSLLL